MVLKEIIIDVLHILYKRKKKNILDVKVLYTDNPKNDFHTKKIYLDCLEYVRGNHPEKIRTINNMKKGFYLNILSRLNDDINCINTLNEAHEADEYDENKLIEYSKSSEILDDIKYYLEILNDDYNVIVIKSENELFDLTEVEEEPSGFFARLGRCVFSIFEPLKYFFYRFKI